MSEAKQTYFETFSSQLWLTLNKEEKKILYEGAKHVKLSLYLHFPSAKYAVKLQISPTITFREDLSSPENFGARLIEESNHLTKVYYSLSRM